MATTSDVKFRIRMPAGGKASLAITVSAGARAGAYASDILPAKAVSISDDMLNVADSASFTVANINGENTGKFKRGQLVEIDESDPDVAGGAWCRVFTGRVMKVTSRSSLRGGSEILVETKDLGWHLSGCHARPLQNINGITIAALLQKLIHPSWGFRATELSGDPDVTIGNVLNRTLKQGRSGVLRAYVPPKTILPYIQVEPGQAPWEILQLYLARTGYLLNVGVDADLIIFRPAYDTDSPYEMLHFYPESDPARRLNNVIGQPTLIESIDGLYSETQCWSTVVKPTKVQEAAISKNPNAQYVHESYKPDGNPLPFYRLQCASDGEAITAEMRKMRATWKYQMDEFQAWQYEVDVPGHSSKGAFYASDTMIPVDDAFHQVGGSYYVQSVRKDFTVRGGATTHLTLRLPGKLDPALQRQLGGGAKRAAAAETTTTVLDNGQTVTVPKVRS
jgi:hypothetical protein